MNNNMCLSLRRICSFFVLILLPALIMAQSDRQEADSLFISTRVNTFFKNNEYFEDYAKGYTLTGSNITAFAQYNIQEKVKVKAGGNFMKYSGQTEFKEVRPYLSIEASLARNLDITLGSYFSESHDMEEILFSTENHLTDLVEEGVRIAYRSKAFRGETWLDWEQFIDHGDPFRERFKVGISAALSVLQKETFTADFFGQAIILHQGGQVDDTDLPVATTVSGLAGLHVMKQFPQKRISQLSVKSALAIYKDNNNAWIYDEGNGALISAMLYSKKSTLELGYWYGEDFVSPYGHPIFQSASLYDFEQVVGDHTISYVRYCYSYPIVRDVHLDFVVEGDYLHQSKQLQYSYFFSLIFNKQFFVSLL